MNVMAPGARIRVPELLQERGWGPMVLVRRFGFAPATAYRLARGEADAVTMDTIERLCSGFEITVAELFEVDLGKDGG